MTAIEQLSEFEGEEVHRSTIKITGAGDGLSEALKIDPVKIHKHEDRYFVVRAKCANVGFPTDKKGVTSRLHTMATEEITMVEEDIAKRFLQAAADNLARRKAEIEGQQQLAYDDATEGQEIIAARAEQAQRDALDEALDQDGE